MYPDSAANQQVSIFDTDYEYIRATAGKRLANFLIDLVVFYCLFFVLGIIIALMAPAFIDTLANGDQGLSLLDRLCSLVLYALYMGIIESALKGRSIGKLVTKTRAVNLDGSIISPKTAFLRGFCRAVPFCAFSALGTPCDPWQDRWTRTIVIDEKQREETIAM
ncbi:MAG TPA: RDD family protein [Niabella sp.]